MARCAVTFGQSELAARGGFVDNGSLASDRPYSRRIRIGNGRSVPHSKREPPVCVSNFRKK